MATLFVVVLHLTAHGWTIDAAYQSRPDTASVCREEGGRFISLFKPPQGERYQVFCQAEPEAA